MSYIYGSSLTEYKYAQTWRNCVFPWRRTGTGSALGDGEAQNELCENQFVLLLQHLIFFL